MTSQKKKLNLRATHRTSQEQNKEQVRKGGLPRWPNFQALERLEEG
jgi:hypothetical protein